MVGTGDDDETCQDIRRDSREQLLQAARELFAARPYGQVRTVEIAELAGAPVEQIDYYFAGKRGLYRAVLNHVTNDIAELQTEPANLPGAFLIDAVRHGLRNHVAYIDRNADSFIALLRGRAGADPSERDFVDKLRWLGAQRALHTLGIVEPISARLRNAMHGWVGYLDEMMADRIENGDVDDEFVVEMALTALVHTVRSVYALDPTVTLSPRVLGALTDYRLGEGN